MEGRKKKEGGSSIGTREGEAGKKIQEGSGSSKDEEMLREARGRKKKKKR